MADLVEELVCHLAEQLCGGLPIAHNDDDGNLLRTINLARPWRRAAYHDFIAAAAAGADFFARTPNGRRERCDTLGVQISAAMEDH
ncbi:MAG: hypothetical protein NTW21_34180 [Verrucomicrobia bacterium]|nr:hypothetical protein [Verrucomicrobiota bacterium]